MVLMGAGHQRGRFGDLTWSPYVVTSVPSYLFLEAAAIQSSDLLELVVLPGQEGRIAMLYGARGPLSLPPQWDANLDGVFYTTDPCTLLAVRDAGGAGKPFAWPDLDFARSMLTTWPTDSVSRFLVEPIWKVPHKVSMPTVLPEGTYVIRLQHDLRDLVLSRVLQTSELEIDDKALGQVASRLKVVRQRGFIWKELLTLLSLEVWKGLHMSLSSDLQLLDPLDENQSARLGVSEFFDRNQADRYYTEVVMPKVQTSTVLGSGMMLSSVKPAVFIEGKFVNGKLEKLTDERGPPISRHMGYSALALARQLHVYRTEDVPAVLHHLAVVALYAGLSGTSATLPDWDEGINRGQLIRQFHEKMAQRRITPVINIR